MVFSASQLAWSVSPSTTSITRQVSSVGSVSGRLLLPVGQTVASPPPITAIPAPVPRMAARFLRLAGAVFVGVGTGILLSLAFLSEAAKCSTPCAAELGLRAKPPSESNDEADERVNQAVLGLVGYHGEGVHGFMP